MKSKGISPLIAAVLLIAFTMAVASLFAQWAPRLMSQAQSGVGNDTRNIQNCQQYTLEIMNANSTHATVQQTNGPDGIGDLVVTWSYSDNPPIQNRDGNIGEVQGLTTVNVSGGNNKDVTEVEASAVEPCQQVQTQWNP